MLVDVICFSVLIVNVLGADCSASWQCGRGEFCESKKCRRDECSSNAQCQMGEECKTGQIHGVFRKACFGSAEMVQMGKNPYCPGGGSTLLVEGGRGLAGCDLFNDCPGSAICNPQNAVCCTKLRTCPLPAKAMLNAITKKPIMCMFKNLREIPCPGKGYCETLTGFCCSTDESSTIIQPPSRPGKAVLGETCTPVVGCDGDAACICELSGQCTCECPKEFGYSPSSDGKSCRRIRRRLKEKCTTDLECSAAFSECTSAGCRCKAGFQRDGNGGCKPINYQCVGKQTPQTKNDQIVKCSLKQHLSFSRIRKLENATEEVAPKSATNSSFEVVHVSFTPEAEVNFENSTEIPIVMHSPLSGDDCDSGFYCVPVFDDAQKPGYYQGFCCPRPPSREPICPVGEPHASSQKPNYGCTGCPDDHFCHRDDISTDKEICCAKPCVSLEDIFVDGQCLSMARHGDSCFVDEQCVASSASPPDGNQVVNLACIEKICTCPSGFSFTDGQCKRIECRVGLRGEPAVDRLGNLIRCTRSSDCSQGSMCDPTGRVCCKGINRCPANFVETGESCSLTSPCSNIEDVCFKTPKSKRICCREEKY